MVKKPTINNFAESFISPEGRFRTMGCFSLVRKKNSAPVHHSSTTTAAFRITTDRGIDKLALCPLSGQRFNVSHYNGLSRYLRDLNSPYVSEMEILPNEVYVFTDDGAGNYHDIILTPYTEGQSLETLLCGLSARKDKDSLERLLKCFTGFAVDYLERREFSHNHLRPAYVHVTPNLHFSVTDYSAMTVPAMAQWDETRDNDIRPMGAIALLLYLTAKFPAVCSNGSGHFSSMESTYEYLNGILGSACKGMPEVVGHIRDTVVNNNSTPDRKEMISLISKIGGLAEAPVNGSVLAEEKSGSEKPYELAGPFHEGLACAVKEGLHGYVNRDGDIIIPLKYDYAWNFEEGLAVIRNGNGYGLIDKTGREVFPPIYEDLSWVPDNGVVFICEDGKWRVAERSGKHLSRFVFDHIGDFEESLACVRKDRKWGYIDRNGMIAIPIWYDYASSFGNNGLAHVRIGKTECYIDTKGEVVDI